MAFEFNSMDLLFAVVVCSLVMFYLGSVYATPSPEYVRVVESSNTSCPTVDAVNAMPEEARPCVCQKCPKCDCPIVEPLMCPTCPTDLIIPDGLKHDLLNLKPDVFGGNICQGCYADCKKDYLCLLDLRSNCAGGGIVRKFNYSQANADWNSSQVCFPKNLVYINPDYWIIEKWGTHGGYKLTHRNNTIGA